MKTFLFSLLILICFESLWVFNLKKDLKLEKAKHQVTALEKTTWKALATEARKEALRHFENGKLCLDREQTSMREAQELQTIFRNATPVNEPKQDTRLMDNETRKSLIMRLNRPLP